MSLKGLLEQATPGLGQTMWTTNAEPDNWRLALSQPDVRLVALAPDMARLLIDVFVDDGKHLKAHVRPALLARFAELEQRAAP